MVYVPVRKLFTGNNIVLLLGFSGLGRILFEPFSQFSGWYLKNLIYYTSI